MLGEIIFQDGKTFLAQNPRGDLRLPERVLEHHPGTCLLYTSVYDCGESGQYLAGEAGTYYLAFLAYDENATGRCTLEINSTKASDTDLENQIAIDASNFPDENFRQYVARELDINKDGFLSQPECNYVTTIDCSYQDIKDLTGIQFFQNLGFLYCTSNQLTALDVTGCPSLRELDCSGNELTALDVTGCPALQVLHCYSNQLTELNVTGCPALQVLYCDSNQLTELNVTKCPALEVLYCLSLIHI